ncbi:ATP-grasp domain-containing protein [Geodermatophilus nigrescens]|uniref:Glutathione synthase/RimK-type ligase, ATP-grasp superfamily n=1 Tax=Geodermatophilus nigrescens TaxID=1070870 RepID=A0A1M5Q6F3_9ACTN|nr:hypothetical protein [Geodermatophilus nigrescens]SHH09486.1 Glutathione synthase/RimK-type ligase, ATP-grasp superfamily [Geodermatophilus nigrescens]
MPDVLLASCAEAAGRDEDEPLLVAALAAEGLTASAADWADPTVDWSAATAVVVRSTWDYAPRRDEFLAWARRVEEGTRLANPAAVLAWNTDKRYLRELAGAGVPVVPTAWAEGPGDVDGALSRWPGDVVVKPVVSAGARDTVRFPPERRAGARELAEGILASGRAVMVQPYLARLDAEGETGLVYVGGVYSHAFGKGALLAGEALGPGLFAEETITARTAGPEQRALGDRVLAWVRERTGETPLYARVDLVPGDDGAPQVIEVELTEPSLFLTTDDGAAARFAAAIRSRIG